MSRVLVQPKLPQSSVHVTDDLLDGFLLVSPPWVDDDAITACTSCTSAFTPIRRKHHCRNCGKIFCQDCSARNIALPQLGHVKPVRVCNGCFDVAYLVGYVLSDGLSTQVHGARGLSEIVEGSGSEHDLSNFIAYGGLDAVIYLCRGRQMPELHMWGASALANFVRHDALQSLVVARGALPYLYDLIFTYCEKAHERSVKVISAQDQDVILTTMLSIGNVFFRIATSGCLSQQLLADGGGRAFDALLELASYQLGSVDSDVGDSLAAMYDRLDEARGLAARTISCLATNPRNQLSMIESSNAALCHLLELLHSSTVEVRKYVAKSIAYLSLRNDKHKAMLIKDGRAKLLSSVIDVSDEQSALDNRVTIAHACCAMANLATNAESQRLLVQQHRLLSNLCRMVGFFIGNREVQRHVARLLANFALYEENERLMLTDDTNSEGDLMNSNVVTTLIAIGHSPVADVEIQRHVIRALDNLLTNAVHKDLLHKLVPCVPLVNYMLTAVQDEDVRKRASQVSDKLSSVASSVETGAETNEAQRQVDPQQPNAYVTRGTYNIDRQRTSRSGGAGHTGYSCQHEPVDDVGGVAYIADELENTYLAEEVGENAKVTIKYEALDDSVDLKAFNAEADIREQNTPDRFDDHVVRSDNYLEQHAWPDDSRNGTPFSALPSNFDFFVDDDGRDYLIDAYLGESEKKCATEIAGHVPVLQHSFAEGNEGNLIDLDYENQSRPQRSTKNAAPLLPPLSKSGGRFDPLGQFMLDD